MQKDKSLHKMHHHLFLQTNKNEMKKYFIGLQNWRSQTSTFLQKVLKFFSWKNVWQNFVAGEMADTMADPETDLTILCPITVYPLPPTPWVLHTNRNGGPVLLHNKLSKHSLFPSAQKQYDRDKTEVSCLIMKIWKTHHFRYTWFN